MGLTRAAVRATAKPELYPKVDLENGSRGADGKPIQVGHLVRRPVYISASMGVEVDTVTGTVERVYRREGGERDLVDFRAPLRFGHGLYTAHADVLRRSAASQE